MRAVQWMRFWVTVAAVPLTAWARDTARGSLEAFFAIDVPK